MGPDEIKIVRQAYARQVAANADVAANRHVEAAFANVPRERFLGADPWLIRNVWGDYVRLSENDPVYAYQDVLFALARSKGINNGQPSLHARMLDALSAEPGQRILHVGAGTGYYSALLSFLVGPSGHVTALEFDDSLGAKARENLRGWENVEVLVGDGLSWPQEPVDRIYVNFGMSTLPSTWIERLLPGGRLVLAIGVPNSRDTPTGPRRGRFGGAFAIGRREAGFAASHVCTAYFIHGETDPGLEDEAALVRLTQAFKSGGQERVKSLVWRMPLDPQRCWYCGSDWGLSYDEP